MNNASMPRRIFVVVNTVFLLLLAAVCLAPMLYLLATSLSDRAVVDAGYVTLWPINPTLSSYKMVIQRQDFLSSFVVSLQRVSLGLIVNMALVVLCAYPLSKDPRQFRLRTFYAWLFMVTMIFPASLIPSYMIVREMGMINSIWSLILPGAVPVWNVVLMINFFRGLPREIEESALIDGAGHLRVMAQFYVPLSLPSIATIALFTIVGHWNAWFDGMIYMNKPNLYPLQTFLRMIEITVDLAKERTTSENARSMAAISDRTLRSAQVFIAMIPVLVIYPFLQKYFTKGMVLGSVKG